MFYEGTNKIIKHSRFYPKKLCLSATEALDISFDVIESVSFAHPVKTVLLICS